jgi:hypothetical protein
MLFGIIHVEKILYLFIYAIKTCSLLKKDPWFRRNQGSDSTS